MRLSLAGIAFVCVLGLVGNSGCKNEYKNRLPNTPEEVVLSWQRYIDLNLLDSARMLSTPYAQGYLSYLDSLSMGQTLEADYNPMTGLVCTVKGDSAECNYYIEDELSEKIPGRLLLVKVQGQWLVDKPIELEMVFPDTLTLEEEREMFQDSLMKD
jgi:hypothetical protein